MIDLLPNRISQHSDSFNLALHDIALFQELRRYESHTNAGGCAGGDDGACLQRHAAGQLFDDIVNLENDIVGKYVQRLLSPYGNVSTAGSAADNETASSGLTMDKLIEFGL